MVLNNASPRLAASVFLPFLPMLPLQLLVQNLLYDISQIGIPFDHVDEGLRTVGGQRVLSLKAVLTPEAAARRQAQSVGILRELFT